MNIGINKKTILSSFHWYETWLDKSNIHSGSGSQSQGRDKFDASKVYFFKAPLLMIAP